MALPQLKAKCRRNGSNRHRNTWLISRSSRAAAWRSGQRNLVSAAASRKRLSHRQSLASLAGQALAMAARRNAGGWPKARHIGSESWRNQRKLSQQAGIEENGGVINGLQWKRKLAAAAKWLGEAMQKSAKASASINATAKYLEINAEEEKKK